MLDGILFEKQGIPAAAIVTDAFVETGRAMARTWGVPDYPFLVMPHPTSNLTEEELEQRAREIAPQVVQLLLTGRSES
ncbi:MAG: hypothetical protein D6736_22185 [Nitrospinota bacterium]|nr:MAG: hypothetical protein D6736_22185 [Nitrospinota bacterium]